MADSIPVLWVRVVTSWQRHMQGNSNFSLSQLGKFARSQRYHAEAPVGDCSMAWGYSIDFRNRAFARLMIEAHRMTLMIVPTVLEWPNGDTVAPHPGRRGVFLYFLVFNVGIYMAYNFVMHVFFGEMAASFIGWAHSPLQAEVGFASLGFAVVGFLAFRGDFSMRLAAIVGPAWFLLGAAGGHVYQMITEGNFGTRQRRHRFLY